MAETCKVVGLYAYPVKSCRGTPMDAVDLSPQGIDGDRQLLILRDGKFINQARLATLARVATRRLNADTIAFEGGGDPWVHSVTDSGESSEINFYGNQIEVVDQGDEVAAYVSAIAGERVRVAALKETFRRSVPLEEFAVVDGINQSRFVDVAPILVTNVASLADLNGRLEHSVPMERFRPNIVIEGLDAFGEDEVTAIQGEGWQLVRATHCERCAVTCTDHLSGERTREPLATLKSYRHRENGYAGGVLFGAYMGVEGEATVRVGDVLTVT